MESQTCSQDLDRMKDLLMYSSLEAAILQILLKAQDAALVLTRTTQSSKHKSLTLIEWPADRQKTSNYQQKAQKRSQCRSVFRSETTASIHGLLVSTVICSTRTHIWWRQFQQRLRSARWLKYSCVLTLSNHSSSVSLEFFFVIILAVPSGPENVIEPIKCNFEEFGNSMGLYINSTYVMCVSPRISGHPDDYYREEVLVRVAINGQDF